MEKCYLIGSRALGDTICATPILRKLFTCYNEKIHVVTHHPKVFERSPYVASVRSFDKEEEECAKEASEKFEVFKTFFEIASHGSDRPERKHNTYDIRQFHATELGMMLKPMEMTCEFFPEANFDRSRLPDNYVCVHAGSTWPSRTWEQSNFQSLISKLALTGIPVVLVGKDDHETGFWGKQDKNVFSLDVSLGLDLTNQLSLSDCWHVIENSSCFITMDSGLLHLAGTTDAQIIQLGSSIDPVLRAPFRHSSQIYKYSFIRGDCGLFCGSDVKYGIAEWGSIHGVPPLISCLEKKKTFECHPNVMQVFQKCLALWNPNNKLELVKESSPKTKVLLVAEHLSTGGMPEVFRKRLETLLKQGCDVFVVEFTLYSDAFIVQRQKIIDLIPKNRFASLGYLNESPEEHKDKRMRLMDIINSFQPDFVHLEEVPEKYMYGGFPDELAEKLYSKDRTYKIFETSHDSGFDPLQYKKYLPDKFIWISKWHLEKYKSFGVPQAVIEYPIELKERPNREESLKALGLDPSYKHVLNVGLFTPRKNQAEVFEYAKKLNGEKIQFHFVGNLAGNFDQYWKPLIENQPDNCKVWGERDDVEKFYQCMDLFVFTSKGHATDRETNPIVIKEALSWGMKLALRNLEVYMGAYDNKSNVSFLSDSINENCELIKNMVSDFPSTAIITHTTKQYLQTAECLVKSLLKFSEHKVILYTQNCEADFDYPNLIKIPFETDFDSEPTLVTDSKGDFFKDAYDEITYKTLCQKSRVILDSLDRGLEKGIYLDTDMIANSNFDTIFDYFKDIENYPLLTEGPFYMMLQDGQAFLEKPLMDNLKVEEESRVWYRQTNTILFNKNCTDFIEEWNRLCNSEFIIREWKLYAPYHEETIINVLLWKEKYNKTLPQTFLNTVNLDTIKYFENCDVEKDWNESMSRVQIDIHEDAGANKNWICFKKDKSLVKLFHGMKNPDKMNPCIDYLDSKR
jgi:ADP-heptose:LPS heptosyltransferase/glycosyltransferase involved in cell wall biosynthesis